MAKINYEKKYYNKLKKSFDRISENDNFYLELSNAINAGRKEIYQKQVKESYVFDATWIDTIENHLQSIDKIIRNPKLYMVANEDVVRIERAKKINARSVAHLSSHTENVQTIQDNGVVVPKKILSVTYEDKLNIYENRFVVSLISKLAAFVEIRYQGIKENITTKQSDHLKATSSFKWRNYSIDCDVDLKVSEEINDEVNRKNLAILDRINTIRNYIKGFVNSDFFKSIRASSPLVVPPILKTNIITHNLDYNSCLQLWQFMDQYRQLGYNADVLEKNLDFDEVFENDVVNMFIYDYSLMVVNQADRQDDYKLKAYRHKNKKNPHIVKNLTGDTLTGGDMEMEDASFNEYYYQKIVEEINDSYNEAISNGKSYKQSLTSIYKKMQGMSNSVYKEALKNLQTDVSENATFKEKRKAKYTYTKRRLSVIKQIAYLKEIELLNTKKEIEKLNKQLEKYNNMKDLYEKELNKQKNESLKKARLAKNNKELANKRKELKENKEQRKLENKARVSDLKKFNSNESKLEEQELLSSLNKEINKQL